MFRRDLLKPAPGGLLATMHGGLLIPKAFDERANSERLAAGHGFVSVKDFGAKGDGATIDTNAINAAIATVSKSGGGSVRFPAGTYVSFSIHLKSSVVLYLEQGATLIAADTPAEGTTSGYDAAEENREGGLFQCD